MNNQQKIVSIIIPTLNRPESIVELSYQLLSQDYPKFEIIVVDQSMGGNRPMWRLAEQYKNRIKYFTLKRVSTTGARNFGVNKSAGEIIIFLDDNCRIDNEDFIAQHVKNYKEEKLGGVGGKVIDANEELNNEQFGPTCTVSKTGRIFPNATSDERQYINAPRGGNMSFLSSVIKEVGGFDERFRGNAMREETDFSLSVVKAGYRIVYDPAAEAVHLGLPFGGSREETRREWYYHFFHNEMLFFMKHFPKHYLPIMYARKLRAIVACMFYYGKGRPSWLMTPFWGFTAGLRSYRKK